MQSVSHIEFAWELYKAGVGVGKIAKKVGKHRATIYRWIKGIRLHGKRRFLQKYRNAKKGRRQRRKTSHLIAREIYRIREEYYHCCGEKIQFLLKEELGVQVSVSTIYRILNKKYRLRPKYKKNTPRGSVPKAKRSKQVIQMDTVDLGELFGYVAIDIYNKHIAVSIKEGLESASGEEFLHESMPVLGPCEIIQTDGGSEFKDKFSKAVNLYAGRQRFSRPYKKNEQSYVERVIFTLRKECVGWTKYKRAERPELQEMIGEYLEYYHKKRPHMGLGMKRPIEVV